MAFQIATSGTREGVIKIVEAAKPNPPDSDATQLEALKPFIVAEINSLPAEFNGARLDASGDAQKNGRQIQISVIPLKLAV